MFSNRSIHGIFQNNPCVGLPRPPIPPVPELVREDSPHKIGPGVGGRGNARDDDKRSGAKCKTLLHCTQRPSAVPS
eukprot:1184172-Prorocentrum_minimum.AAC.3